MQYRTTVSAGDDFDFIISDGSMDRHGTRINPNGWDLSEFRKNPQALWAHGRDPVRGTLPIGHWANIRVEAGKLVGRLVLAEEKTSAFVSEIRSLVKQGILRAVSVGMDYIKEGKRGGPWEIERAGLREVSLVAVGSNPNALAMARSLDISESTIRTVFGKHANGDNRDVSTGEHAVTSANRNRSRVDVRSNSKETKMTTASQRLIEAQDAHAAAKARRDVMLSAEQLDHDGITAINEELAELARDITVLKASEVSAASTVSATTGRRPLGISQPDVKASDLIVRSAVCHLLAHISGRPVETILEERYPGHEATAAVTRTAIAVAATTTSGWASQLVQTAMAEFLALLPPNSVYPVLRSMGVGLTFGPNSGAIKIPFSSTTAALAGGFVLEGDPIPVGRLTLDSVTLTPHKFGIIVPMTKEVMRYTNPALEAVVRSELLARTAIKLDSLLIDSTVGSATRPAGLLYGVSAAATAFGGGDYTAFLEDMKALLAPFDTANAGRSLALLMNPAQARNVRMMAGPNNSGFGWANQFLADFRVIASTSVTAGTVIAVDTADFVTSTGDTPMFETSDQATIHMEDTPTALSAVASPNTVAAPIRSMFQTNSVALKMTMDVSWAMRRAGMVQYISSVTW